MTAMAWLSAVAIAEDDASTTKPDVRVVVDVSGSMKETDPSNLRASALKLLVNLAAPGSQMGIWSFGDTTAVMSPFGKVDEAWKKSASGAAERVSSNAPFTQVGLALEHAANRQWTRDPASDRTMILLSDGRVDVSKNVVENQREQSRIFSYVVPRLKEGGYRVHAIALSRAADTVFLKRLADETGGTFSLALTADDLMKLFVKASDKVNKPLQVPLVDSEFRIDSLVNEFTALIYRKPNSPPVSIVSPAKRRITSKDGDANVRWFSDPHFDLVTVTKPEPGTWKIEGQIDTNDRVTVVSNLDLAINGLPSDVLAGEKIMMEMSLTENGKTLLYPRFLSLMDINFAQQSDHGEHFDGHLSRDKTGGSIVPVDGIYRARLGRTLTEGEHQFTVTVDGKTFERVKHQQMVAHKDAVTVSVENGFSEGRESKYLLMRPKIAVVRTEDLKISAQIADPDGSKIDRDVVPNDAGQWRLDVPSSGKLGMFRVFLTVSGQTKAGNSFVVKQGPVDVDYTPGDTKASVADDQPAAVVPADLDVGEAFQVEPAPAEESVPAEASVEAKPEIASAPPPPPKSLPEKTEDDAAPPAPSEDSPSGTQSKAWVPWVAFGLGNLLLMGGGLFFYMNFMQESDEEQTRLVEELSKIKESPRRSGYDTPSYDASAMAMAPAYTFPSDASMSPDLRTVSPPAGAAFTPVAPAGPIIDRGYRMEAAPLELDDDNMIEFDDDDDGEVDALSAQLAAHAAAQSNKKQPVDHLDLELAEPEPVTSQQKLDEPLSLEVFQKPEEAGYHSEFDEDAFAAELEAAASEVLASNATNEPATVDDLDAILAEQQALEAQFAAIENSLGNNAAFAEDEFKLDNPSA